MSVLNTDLLRAVETELVPRVRHLGFAITEHQEGQSFDNATVTLASGDIRVRVFRERGVGGVLDGIGSFLNSSSADLQRMFDKASFRETNRALEILRDQRSIRRWGS